MLPIILVLTLVMAVLFAWKAWRRYPASASLAAAIATVAGMLLFRNPLLLLIGVMVSIWIAREAKNRGA